MEEKIKERIMSDAIQIAMKQHKTIRRQRIAIITLCAGAIVLALKGV